MSLSPVWNGTIPGHRDQYERMAQSILNGHLYLEYEDVDPRLSEMENPYDPQARKELGIYYHWDHAFYNGKYYMYFGQEMRLLHTKQHRFLLWGQSLLFLHYLISYEKNFFLKCHLTYI